MANITKLSSNRAKKSKRVLAIFLFIDKGHKNLEFMIALFGITAFGFLEK